MSRPYIFKTYLYLSNYLRLYVCLYMCINVTLQCLITLGAPNDYQCVAIDRMSLGSRYCLECFGLIGKSHKLNRGVRTFFKVGGQSQKIFDW